MIHRLYAQIRLMIYAAGDSSLQLFTTETCVVVALALTLDRTDGKLNDIYLKYSILIFSDSLIRREHTTALIVRLVLLLFIQAMGILSSMVDGFQSGYRWLSVCWTGPAVAQSLCK